MTPQHDKPKRWRPRFSVRTLVIVVTLVCVYMACWAVTRSMGSHDVALLRGAPSTVTCAAPFVVLARYPINTGHRIFDPVSGKQVAGPARSDEMQVGYFWFFGYVAKLPYEREIHHENNKVPMLKTIPSISLRRPASTRPTHLTPRIFIEEKEEERLKIEITP